MAASTRSVCRLRVVHAHPPAGAGRRLYELHQPFTPRWLLYAIQRPLGRIASMPATGHYVELCIMAVMHKFPIMCSPRIEMSRCRGMEGRSVPKSLHIISMSAEHPIGSGPADSGERRTRGSRVLRGSLNQAASVEPLGESVSSTAEDLGIM